MSLPDLAPEDPYFTLFLQNIQTCKKGVDAFAAMLQDYRDLKSQAEHIHGIEHEGDGVTKSMFHLLNRTVETPFDRQDVIALASITDEVLDLVDEVATMLVLYGVDQPSVYLLEASTLLQRAVDQLVKAIGLLQTLQGLEPFVEEVHRVENEADQLYHNAIAELFLPDAYTPLDVIRWKSIYDVVERAFDTCEDVGNVLQGVVLKNSFTA